MSKINTGKLQTTKYCPHCDPYEINQWHFMERIANVSPMRFISTPFDFLRVRHFRTFHTVSNFVENCVYRLLIATCILREQKISDSDTRISNRTMVLLREARNRKMGAAVLTFMNKPLPIFSITVSAKKNYFYVLPCNKRQLFDFDDKYILKKVLGDNGLPHPKGKSFTDPKLAVKYIVDELHFPVVVKPTEGSLSKHVTVCITSEEKLYQAIAVSQILKKNFVVEEFISGDVYRIAVIGGKVIAGCMRESPNVIGDGKHTIAELVEIKNADPRRGTINQKNFTLHKISMAKHSVDILKRQNMILETVPPHGKKIYLNNKVTLAAGADIHDVTDDIHPDNKIMFEQIAQLTGADLIGIDFICSNISKSWKDQKCAVIEANSSPYIDMHHVPFTGTPRNVSGAIIDLLEKRNNVRSFANPQSALDF